jgi:hypothetical protein
VSHATGTCPWCQESWDACLGHTAQGQEHTETTPADGAEPDRAATYEQARRAALTTEELERRLSDALAASGDLARNLLMLDAAGMEVPTEVLRAQQTVAHWLMDLEVMPTERR